MSATSSSRRAGIRVVLPLLLLTGAATAGGQAHARPAPGVASAGWQHVVVSGTADSATVSRAVAAVGGEVSRELPVINGAAARVPANALSRLRAMPGVRAVTHDAKGHLLGVDPALGYDVTGDDGSLFHIGQVTNARNAWQSGWTGKGVDVALIDSGVAPVTGLTSGNVVNGPDLSFESQNPQLTRLDTFGHGTHMASIIVGRDVADTGASYASSTSRRFNGVAPDARLISLKVASNDGATDVSQVIAAIDWVVAHKNDPGFNIRVLNLSYGTDSRQDPSIDPLCFAVENAWRAGIVVVVAGGNDGTARTRLANPAQDPLVLSVGASDPRGTNTVEDDVMTSWTQPGTAARRLDVLAPGVHVLGLRVPGSRIDQENPNAVVGSRFFRGSGTSQAAAVVSGLVAQYLQKYPNARPDQVKKAIIATAEVPDSLSSSNLGVANITKALGQRPTWTQGPTGATGTGSLEAARGSVHVTDGTSTLTGEQDIFGKAWDGATWAAATTTGTAWNGGDWNGSTWTGSSWSGSSWSGSSWSGASWSGSSWSGSSWSGSSWSGPSWSGASWSGSSWSGASWSGSSWSGSSWSGSGWSAVGWE